MNRDSSAGFEKWFFVLPLVCLLLLLIVNNSGRDIQIFLWLNHLGRFGSDNFWIATTTFGDGLVLFVLTLVFIRRKPALAWSLIVSWLLLALWIKGLKAAIVTYRPPSVLDLATFRLVGPHYLFNSFPSGHATSIAAFTGSICIFLRSRWLRIVAVSVAVLVGFSRIAMGVHWATDVLAGLMAGWITAIVGFYLSQRLQFGTSRPAQIIFAIITAGAAVRMFLVNHTDYPQASLLLQIVAAGSLVFACADYFLAGQKMRKRGSSTLTEHRQPKRSSTV